MSEFRRQVQYGECPVCGEMCQPPDGKEDGFYEFCSCDKCETWWWIVFDDDFDYHPPGMLFNVLKFDER